MGDIFGGETTIEKNLVTLVGVFVVAAGLGALIFGAYTLGERGQLLALVGGSTLLGCLGAGYLWVSDRRGSAE